MSAEQDVKTLVSVLLDLLEEAMMEATHPQVLDFGTLSTVRERWTPVLEDILENTGRPLWNL